MRMTRRMQHLKNEETFDTVDFACPFLAAATQAHHNPGGIRRGIDGTLHLVAGFTAGPFQRDRRRGAGGAGVSRGFGDVRSHGGGVLRSGVG